MQIVVLGAHRSGTSALTRLINMMGAYAGAEGSTIGFNPENPKGFWERRDVINANDALMLAQNASWQDLLHWDAGTLATGELDDAVKHTVLELDHHRPWVMKDPRLSHTLPQWLTHLEVPVAVICWRDPMEVANSLHRRNGMAIPHALALWERGTRDAIVHAAYLPRLLVSYSELMRDPAAELTRVHGWLAEQGIQGLRLPSEKEITAFIDPSLRRSATASDDSALSPEQKTLKTALLVGDVSQIDAEESARNGDVWQVAHSYRLMEDEKERIRLFSDTQAERIRELETQIAAFEGTPMWTLAESDWNALIARLNADMASLRDQIAGVRADTLIGRLRRLFKGGC